MSLLNFVVCLFVVQKRIAWLEWNVIGRNVISCSVAAGVMGYYLSLVNRFSWQQGRFILDFPILLFIIAGGGVIYFALSALLKVDELNFLAKKLKKRV